MKIERSEEQNTAARRFGELARACVDEEIAAGIKSLAGDGLIGLAGRDGGWGRAVAALEAIASEAPALALGSALNLVAADLVYRWGRCDALRVLEDLLKGRAVGALIGVDDDLENVSMSADELSLQTPRVCLAPVADVFVVVVPREAGVAVVAFAHDEAGIEVGAQLESTGMIDAASAPVSLMSAPLAKACIVGANPLPSSEPEALLARWSLGLAAVMVGVAGAAFEQVTNFARECEVGGKALFKHQSASFAMAETFAALETARLMMDRAAGAVDADDREALTLCSSARLLADDLVEEITTKGSRVLGMAGPVTDAKFHGLLADAGAVRFMGGGPDGLLDSIFEAVAGDV